MEIWDIYNRDKVLTGKERPRGTDLESGEFHLVALIWLRGKDGRYLISKRSAEKIGAGLWETTGGSALQGENSIEAAIREVREEVGLYISEEELTFLKTVRHGHDSGWFADYWLIDKDIDINQVICQTTEVECVKWATRQEIIDMIHEGLFFHGQHHLEALFNSQLL